MSSELAIRPASSPISARAEEVLDKIMNIKGTLMRRSLELGRLLKEARDNNYAHEWGFPRFNEWVEEASGLDISARSAYDLIKLVERSAYLQIPDEVLEKNKISNLKQIFSLKSGEKTDDEVRELVVSSIPLSVKAVTNIVNAAKQQEWVNRSYKFDKTAYDEVIVPAVERTKREYGSTMNEEGDNVDVSDSKVIEMWAAEKLAEPEELFEDALEAEYEDSFEIEDTVAA